MRQNGFDKGAKSDDLWAVTINIII
jgi:hypothetical protein